MFERCRLLSYIGTVAAFLEIVQKQQWAATIRPKHQ
jgi:hypothetical protein